MQHGLWAVGLAAALWGCSTTDATDDTPDDSLVCSDTIGCVSHAPDEPIHLGYLLATEGDVAFLGLETLKAIDIALEDRGQVLGHEVLLTGENTGCRGVVAAAAATTLAADPTISAVFGTTCSGGMAEAMPIVGDAGLTTCSSTNTSPALTEDPIWKPGYYRTSVNDLLQAQISAGFAYSELGLRTAATLHDGDPYTSALAGAFAEAFAALGGVVTYEGTVDRDASDMSVPLEAAGATSPDLLFLPIFLPAGGHVVSQAPGTAGLEDAVLMGSDALFATDFSWAGDQGVGMYLSAPYVAGSAYEAFLTRWFEAYGETPGSPFAPHAIDCTNLVLDAIERASQVDADGTLLLGRQALRDEMTATADYPGISGSLTCSPNGECAAPGSIGIFQLTASDVAGTTYPDDPVWTPSSRR